MANTDFRSALQGTNEIELTVTGRVSGRSHSYPVWFTVNGNTLYLVPVHGTDTQWYKNVRKQPAIQLSSRGKSLTASVTPVTDQTHVDQIVETFRSKYGQSAVKQYYSKYNAAVEVPLA